YNQVAIFSTYGPQIDLVAPGVNILSTYNNEAENLYSAQSGTSMAAPIVSSAISLLLSVNSDLNFEEIKTYLANSCQKIGDDNFTNLYGNGLLDVHKLLTNQNNMVLEITSPKDNSYIDNDVEIRGTAIASNFWRYSVAYTTSNNPSSLDWNDVETHLNTPKYYYTPVENGVLAHFETPNIEESYTIRLDLVTSDNKHHYYMQTVNIDKTPPELNHAYYMKRYKAEMPQYFVQTVFDDVVNIKMEIETESETYSVKNNYPDSIMVQKLPSNINSGEAKINVFAKNLSAMENSWQEIVNFNIDSQSIDFNTFSSQYLDNELKLVNNTIDFNEDSIAEEFLATEISGASQTNRIYELQNDELSTLYSFHDIFYPLDITHSWQNDEILALGISNNQGVVYRVFQREKGYSDSLFWNTNQVYGGAFIDFDMDGKDELALIKNKTINNVTKRVIELYDENFEEVEYLLNNTPTTVRNEFIALKCADLNNDGNVEILTADKDGDVMIFTNAEEGFELTWHTKLPVENCYYLDINDYNGNGTLEFCAGGFTQNELDQNKTFSYFAVFTLGNNGYEMLDYISFAEVIEKNSLTSGDLDADGDAELIFAATPNIYIADFFENKLQPMWQNSVNSIENNSILCLPASRRILVNDGLVGDYHSVLIKPQNFNGPATPHNFTVVPLDENKVKLEWQNSASSKIYRKYKENINLIAETSTNSFVDSTFSSLNSFSIEDSLYYRVTTVDDEMEPAESLPTPWKIAIPNYVPSLNKIEMNSANELLVEFDTPLANSALNCGNYEVNNNIGRPVSINSVAQQKGLLMRFANHFEQINNYSLHIDILQGRTGVTQTDLNFNFQYKEDVIGPYITGVEIKDDAVVKIYFNESLNQESVADTSNFKMVMPSIDSHNKLVNTQYIENSGEYVILLHMYKQLEYSNQAYFVKLENIEDITGNVIQNDGNKTHFRLTDIVDLNHLIIYPNPFNTNKYEHISFANLPLEKSGKIWIYELDGNLIFKDEIGELSQLENVYRWDGRNNSGKKISSGLYIFVLNIDDKYKRGKIAIIN
ncbi:MAG: S8 family serine peptidase, partial [Candidatus Cloacimonadota bacterium]|nr:S8 family serine peptidase [Candidatus Cloacimonadota bacterium]